MAKQRMSFRDAVDLVDDDLPDGAFWAMAHEIAGLEYGDGFHELLPDQEPVFSVGKRLRAKIEKFGNLVNNDRYHWQVRKGRNVIADWWPHKRKWRIGGKLAVGSETEFVKALSAVSGVEG